MAKAAAAMARAAAAAGSFLEPSPSHSQKRRRPRARPAESKGGYTRRGEVRALGGGRRCGATAAQAACTGRAPAEGWGPGHGRSAR
eukprot:scaffold42939_cov45-Phaeocystis_antarctica.AAC.2